MEKNHLDIIIPIKDIIEKKASQVDFIEIISLVFHAVSILSDKRTNYWKLLYSEFRHDLKKQNKQKWPVLNITNNEFNKRFDIYISKPFIESDNILTLLYRLLYIETHKCQDINKNGYKSILNNLLEKNKDTCHVKKISLYRLFELLVEQLDNYVKIYNDNTKIEYSLGQKIINLIERD
ncbi:hypothetical protein H012_gp667 [Acanthamoeba polyphaga moumouvirus]|uniref:Uncharacterized protein n=1 Tax=Acanthamoeba polyphaga moumouvirus TaxID=1269028 RepID=L7RCQ0_9VIRU|nr:hypothetical protein H012_gp667 [Acanthamoeba polyphaga moumouvirus]AGC01798.1 hypothetical protein Moumou_00254 [Acanthamoeba polyphaga moumouvirus]